MSLSNSSDLILQVSPSPTSLFPQTAVLQLAACSGPPITRYLATNPDDPIDGELISPRRLTRTIQDYGHHELNPRLICVYAFLKGRLVGLAVWSPPKSFWHRETLADLIYRKGIEYSDVVEDWLFPQTWVIPNRKAQFAKARAECMETYLGTGKKYETWT